MMTNTCSLTEKHCVPCQGGVPPLPENDINRLLSELSGWVLNQSGHLTKTYLFDNFMDPINFANKIATLAEIEGHHPDLTIAWGRLSVEMWTHKINGLTESDFILAAKIDDIEH